MLFYLLPFSKSKNLNCVYYNEVQVIFVQVLVLETEVQLCLSTRSRVEITLVLLIPVSYIIPFIHIRKIQRVLK